MNLREQEYVLAIANYQTLKGAAEFLNVSPPTLSVFLSTLEHALGVPLFNRFGKKFVPTEVGETYIRYAREMCFLNRQWEARLYDIKHGERGVLRLGLHPRRTTYLLPAALRELTIRHPSIDVKLYEGSSEELFHLLLDGEVDLIINNRPNPAPVLEFIPFYRDRLVAVLSPLHPLACKAVSIPGSSLPWIDLSPVCRGNLYFTAPGPVFADVYRSGTGLCGGASAAPLYGGKSGVRCTNGGRGAGCGIQFLGVYPALFVS